jgi:formiminotetrahydrofolate cyclodeaminase
MSANITEKTFRQMMNEISDQHYPMTGTVIAAMATQAAALAEACMQISLDNQVDKLNWQEATNQIGQMAHIKETLLEWCNQHTSQMSDCMSMSHHTVELRSQQTLCDNSAEISNLSIQAAKILQDFRPLAFEQVGADLEVALNLLTITAKTAIGLLDSNIRRWPDETLLAEYEPVLADLEAQLKQLDLK